MEGGWLKVKAKERERRLLCGCPSLAVSLMVIRPKAVAAGGCEAKVTGSTWAGVSGTGSRNEPWVAGNSGDGKSQNLIGCSRSNSREEHHLRSGVLIDR